MSASGPVTPAVDDEDNDLLVGQWFLNEGYARRSGVYLHNLIMKRVLGGPMPEGHEVEHINRDRLDNRRANLRLATRSQNAVNSARKGSGQFRGVTWDKSREKWTAGIKVQYVRQNLDRFDTQEAVAQAYDVAALREFGEFAVLNFPEVAA